MPGVSTHKSKGGDTIDIFCCNSKLSVFSCLVLDDFDVYRDRQLFIYKCPVCNKEKYLLIEYNIINNALVFNRNKPKRQKDIEQWLKKVKEKAVNKAFIIKKGNKSNMGFIFGVNFKDKQLGKDFNNTVRFVKINDV